MANKTHPWKQVFINKDTIIACQDVYVRRSFFGGIFQSASATILFDVGIFLILYRCTRFLLKPLGMPYVAQLLAGFMIGPIFGIYMNKFAINSPELAAISTILSQIGFILHVFILGLEVKLRQLTKVGKKSFVIGFAGMLTSVAFSFGIYSIVKGSLAPEEIPRTMPGILILNATNFLMSTSSHVNDLGISNSKLGQLAAASSMVLDMTVMILTTLAFNLITPLIQGGEAAWQSLILFYYASLFLVFRPLIAYLVRLKPEGKPMKQIHFVMIVLLILILGLLGQVVDQTFSPFLVALTLPEEPLATILRDRLDPFASNVLFPLFVLIRGRQMNLHGFSSPVSIVIIKVLVMGYIGKFIGTLISSKILRLPLSQAITMSLIMSSRGLLDLYSQYGQLQTRGINVVQYTICVIFSLSTMGVFLPFAKFLYEPSRQYSTILRQSVIDFQGRNGVLLILVCVHKEESLPGLLHILGLCNSTSENPISVIALQLLQLTGQCSMPIMAPLHEVSSISALKSNIERCTRIVNSFLSLERESEGMTRAQHFVAMSPYATMHNDICNLSYEKKVGLVIIPFHVSWAPDGKVKESSLSIRGVNSLVLQKAPCSVGILIDRSIMRNDGAVDNDLYKITVVFVGGTDDYEALAYSRLFADHPNVRLDIIWFKAPMNEEKNEIDYEVMKQFHNVCGYNERITFREVTVNNGAEIVEVMVALKHEVDLVIIGKYHNLTIIPMLGLSDGWSEYPELGVLGDHLASSDFAFSLLIVQQEHHTDFTLDFEENL